MCSSLPCSSAAPCSPRSAPQTSRTPHPPHLALGRRAPQERAQGREGRAEARRGLPRPLLPRLLFPPPPRPLQHGARHSRRPRPVHAAVTVRACATRPRRPPPQGGAAATPAAEVGGWGGRGKWGIKVKFGKGGGVSEWFHGWG